MRVFSFMLLLLCAVVGRADEICWYEPTDATQADEITIYYDATKEMPN